MPSAFIAPHSVRMGGLDLSTLMPEPSVQVTVYEDEELMHPLVTMALSEWCDGRSAPAATRTLTHTTSLFLSSNCEGDASPIIMRVPIPLSIAALHAAKKKAKKGAEPTSPPTMYDKLELNAPAGDKVPERVLTLSPLLRANGTSPPSA